MCLKNKIEVLVLIFITFIIPTLVTGQSSFSRGFGEGFEQGYCYNDPAGCTPPSPPATPSTTAYESINSYNDGYNRGFQLALTAKEKGVRGGFKATKTKFVDEAMYVRYKNIDMDNIKKIAKALRNLKRKALTDLNNENYYGAIKLAKLGLKINYKDDEFPMVLGQAYKGLGRYKKSIRWYKKSQRKSYREPIARLIKRLEKKQYQKKERDKSEEENEYSFKKISQILQNGNYDKVIEMVDKRTDKKKISSVYGLRGLANYQLENYKQTIKDITKMVEQEDKIPAIFLFYRALAKSNTGDYYGAINDYNAWLKKDGDNKTQKKATVINNIAYSYVKLDKYREALPIVNKALKIEKIGYIWDTRAEIYLNLNRNDEAIKDATRALKLEQSANSYLIRGQAYINKNKIKNGCTDLSKAGQLGKEEAYEMIEKYCK